MEKDQNKSLRWWKICGGRAVRCRARNQCVRLRDSFFPSSLLLPLPKGKRGARRCRET